MLHRMFINLLLSYSIFLLDSSVFSILQFLGNFLRGIPGEDDSSFPTHCTSVLCHAELELPIDWLPAIVVLEIRALVATQLMHILNFFAPNFGSPCLTQSMIIFSELNFNTEPLVELFVPGVLGDLVRQNRIL